MKEKINSLIAQCKKSVENATDLKDIKEIKQTYVGKSGEFTKLLKGLRDVPKEERPEAGNLINKGKMEALDYINKAEQEIANKEKLEKMKSETIDITLPGKARSIGTLHPLTQVKEEIIDIFAGLGFSVKEGPEIETDFFNFQALNIPLDHPARDMQDTFYITENILLRTHTSPMQARTMQVEQPPIKIVVPGKVYRSDDDATHSPMFQQIEGLYVDKGVKLVDLKATLDQFAKKFFSSESRTRFRPSYFPFTEPSVEVDVSCICGGEGCRLCKGTGWIEILGAGIVNPKVLDNCGIDSKEYSGFAFGIGIERLAMMKYSIPDMRILFENDVRFLKQYK